MKCDELKPLKNIEIAFNTTTEQEQVIAEDSEGNCYGFDSWEEVYLKDQVDAAIAELKAENRKLKRALWLTRAEICRRFDVDRYLRNHRNSWYNENCLTWNDACVAMDVKMCKAERKCRDKAEEYK
jgi:hypothetical protein